MDKTCMNCKEEYRCNWELAGEELACESWEPDAQAVQADSLHEPERPLIFSAVEVKTDLPALP